MKVSVSAMFWAPRIQHGARDSGFVYMALTIFERAGEADVNQIMTNVQ